ncbi:MAG: hypothetical protein JW957_00005 [Candidatus Omnitrophica bacterium]|nr:hypothetical protein [Candidatus Omnitrophota bacterium]
MFLIIEQNEELAEIYNRLLLNAGYDGLLKNSYRDAINLAEKEVSDIDFVVADAGKNQDISGIIQILKKFKNCKICLIVDETTPEIEKIVSVYQISSLLVKPFIPSQLLKVVFLLDRKIV